MKLIKLKFHIWFKYGLKAQKFQKQHALKGRVFKIYYFFDTFFCTEIQVNSHEINVLRIQKCDIF